MSIGLDCHLTICCSHRADPPHTTAGHSSGEKACSPVSRVKCLQIPYQSMCLFPTMRDLLDLSPVVFVRSVSESPEFILLVCFRPQDLEHTHTHTSSTHLQTLPPKKYSKHQKHRPAPFRDVADGDVLFGPSGFSGRPMPRSWWTSSSSWSSSEAPR